MEQVELLKRMNDKLRRQYTVSKQNLMGQEYTLKERQVLLKFANEEKEKLNQEIRRLQIELESKHELLDESRKGCEQKIERRFRENESIDFKRKQGEKAKKDNELSELDKKLKRLKERKKQFEIEKIRHDFDFSRLKGNHDKDNLENTDHERNIGELEEAIQALDSQVMAHDKRIDKEKRTHEDLSGKFQRHSIDYQQYKAEMEQRQKNLKMDDAMSRIKPDELNKLVSNNNSTNKTISNFLEQWDNIV